MKDIEELEAAVRALSSKKAEKITALRVKDITSLANYFVIASGSSTTHVKALADEVEYQMSQKGIEPHGIDGSPSSNWIVLDYIDVVVHIFNEEAREFYQLEHLWADGEPVDVSEWDK